MSLRTRLRWRGDEARGAVEGGAADGIDDGAEFLLEQANRTVPIEEGTLQRSGNTDVDRRALQATVFYDTPYAVVQHEDLELRHDPGRRAKWLERTLEEERERIQAHVAGKIRDALR